MPMMLMMLREKPMISWPMIAPTTPKGMAIITIRGWM